MTYLRKYYVSANESVYIAKTLLNLKGLAFPMISKRNVEYFLSFVWQVSIVAGSEYSDSCAIYIIKYVYIQFSGNSVSDVLC